MGQKQVSNFKRIEPSSLFSDLSKVKVEVNSKTIFEKYKLSPGNDGTHL